MASRKPKTKVNVKNSPGYNRDYYYREQPSNSKSMKRKYDERPLTKEEFREKEVERILKLPSTKRDLRMAEGSGLGLVAGGINAEVRENAKKAGYENRTGALRTDQLMPYIREKVEEAKEELREQEK